MAPRPRKKKAAPRRTARKPRPASRPSRARAKSTRKTSALPPIPPPVPAKPPQPARMKMWKRIAYVLASVIYLTPVFFHSVSNSLHFEKAMPEQNKFFHDLLLLMQNGEEDKVLALFSPSVRDESKQGLEALMDSFKQAGDFQDSHLLRTTWTAGDQSWEMIYYLDYEKGYGLADLKIHRGDQGFVVDQFIINPLHQNFDQSCEFPSLLDINIFKLFFLLLGYLLVLLNAKTLVECCYSPLKPKWLWILFILIGFGAITFYLDPGTGMNLDLFSAHVPIAQIGKDPLWNPWSVTLTFPLGMLVFLWMKRKGLNRAG